MHELALTRNILDLALKHAGRRPIKYVNLLIGEFSDERAEAIRFYWEELSKGTCAQIAELHFECVAAQMKCLDCEAVFHPPDEAAACPNCQSQRLLLIGGDRVQIESIDVE